MSEQQRRQEEASRALIEVRTIVSSDRTRLTGYYGDCAKAIAAAAYRLGCDPEELAARLSDGRIAEYIQACDTTLSLFEEPSPRERVTDRLADVTAWARAEADAYEARSAEILARLREVADELHRASHAEWHWKDRWRHLRASLDDLEERRRQGVFDRENRSGSRPAISAPASE